MKICLAQINSAKGDVDKNIETHIKWVKLAIKNQASLICFPELSLTGYEPTLSKKLASRHDDPRLDVFQELSDQYDILIALGMPVIEAQKIYIGMIIISPKREKQTYTKQILHEDELPYFNAGDKQIIIGIKEAKIAPAICYESMKEEHLKEAKSMGATAYLASVAKNEAGVQSAYNYYPNMAVKYDIPILMSNCVGYCDNFLSTGQSGVWNANGKLLGKLDSDNEGLIIFDTLTEEFSRIA